MAKDGHGPGRGTDQYESAGYAAKKSQCEPQRRPIRKAHGERSDPDADQAPAHKAKSTENRFDPAVWAIAATLGGLFWRSKATCTGPVERAARGRGFTRGA